MEVSDRELTVSKGRFEGLSDGIFAVAMTLLVLEVRLPSGVGANSPVSAQIHALLSIWPQYLVYAATFANIGVMWFNHHALLDRAHRITHGVVAANLFLLGVICFLPFTTYILAELDLSRPAAVLYGLTNVAIGLGYAFVQRAVFRAHGKRSEPITSWNLVGLSGYPIATVVAFFFPMVSIIIITLVALFYALPRGVESSRLPLDD